jgi:two-component system, LytTR family, sensor kinase
MKKIIFLFAAFYLFSFQTMSEETSQFEDLAWKVISERLFNGKNSKAFRYEGEIRFQFKGDPNEQDSIVLNEIIDKLNILMEITKVKLVDADGNFIITVFPPNNGTIESKNQKTYQSEITQTELGFGQSTIPTMEDKRAYFYYYIIRHLTKLYTPRYGSSGYNGILDSEEIPDKVTFTEVDQEIIRQLYSKDFYKDLKKNVSNQKGYLFYLNMRYENWVKRISMSIAILLTIIGFLYLLSIELKSKSNVNFWKYFKKGILIVLWISIIYYFIKLTGFIPFLKIMNIIISIIAHIFEMLIYGSFSLIIIYFSDRFFLKKFNDFFQKQIFVFCSTVINILFVYFTISLPFIYLNSLVILGKVSYSSHLKLSIVYDILIIAFLRVLFNFIKYRMESMVNKKDVELAQMKALKNQAELNALHSRINPHFLYNSLNSIAGLAHSDPDKTEKMATSLSSLFRYSINKEDKTYSTVNEELDMVEKYLEVEKVRFGDKLDYTIEADENIRKKDIPKFIIQPLVENALKHGLSKIAGVGKLKIKVFQEEKDLIIQVFDNGPDFPDEPVKGYGLQNLHDKLRILYSDEAILNWQNGGNKNIQITLKNQF